MLAYYAISDLFLMLASYPVGFYSRDFFMPYLGESQFVCVDLFRRGFSFIPSAVSFFLIPWSQ
jgi:hypothetical protein